LSEITDLERTNRRLARRRYLRALWRYSTVFQANAIGQPVPAEILEELEIAALLERTAFTDARQAPETDAAQPISDTTRTA
jgi:hypothetical protein